MVRAPHLDGGHNGLRTDQLVEAVDLFPTMVDIAAGEPVPSYCDGLSLKPLLAAPTVPVKQAAFSEVMPRCHHLLLSPHSSLPTPLSPLHFWFLLSSRS